METLEEKFLPTLDFYNNTIKPFITDRVYNQSKVLETPYIIQILNEKYEFDFNYDSVQNILSTLNVMDDEKQSIYSYIIKEIDETTRISRWVYDYNLGHEIEKYEYHSDDKEQIKIYKETPNMVFRRTSRKIQQGILGLIDDKNSKYIEETDWIKTLKKLYKSKKDKSYLNSLMIALQEKFYFDMIHLNFLPSSPFLFNQGRYALKNRMDETFISYYKPLGMMKIEDWELIYSITDQQFGSCYSMGSIDDDIKAIYDQSFNQAEIFRNQGGYGVNFSKLRSNYQPVNSIGSKSSGQVSFMEMFNLNTKLIQLHSNTKRGASMFLLDVNHPEIMNFINAKTDFDKGYNNLRYANISMVINNKFMDKVYSDEEWDIVDPSLKTANANLLPSELTFKYKQRDIWNNQILNATLHAEPGIINEDSINEDNPLFPIETITSVNPCVTGDTLVPTNKGLIRADKLEEGMLTWNPIKNRMDEITKVFNNGVKDIYRVAATCDIGEVNTLVATAEHKLMRVRFDESEPENEILEMIPISELKPGDLVKVVFSRTDDQPYKAFTGLNTAHKTNARIFSIRHIGQDVVYDITVPGDYMWVTNGFVSLDCAEYLGQDKSVCNLGSINLYQHITKGGVIEGRVLQSTINSLYLFLTLSNFANDFPLSELTDNTRKYRNIGMGIMGVQSTFIYKDIPYGSVESMEILNYVMKLFNRTQLENSVNMAKLIGQYDKFDTVKEKLNPSNNDSWIYQLNNTNKESGIILNNDDQIQNARLLAIQPNGSIGFISNISCGTDTIFSLAYERTVNSGFQSEYKKIQYDQSIYDILIHRYKMTDDEQQVEISKLGKGEIPEVFNNCNSLSTTSTVGVVEKLQILSMSNRYLDMNTSTTFNIMKDTNLDPENLEKFLNFEDPILEDQYNKYKTIRFKTKALDIIKTNLQAFKSQANYIQVNFQSQTEKQLLYNLMDKQEEDIQFQYKKISEMEGFKKLEKIIQAVNDFYLLSQILKIKGVTVYVEGSRPPVLKQIKKRDKIDKKDTGDKLEFNLDGLSLLLDKKSNKLAPKDVPPYIHRIMKPVKFTTDKNNGNKEYRINVEVGFLDDTQEPFEVFFRQTNSIKDLHIDPVEFLDACARLLSWGMRSGADPEYGLVQLGKQKTFENSYSFLSGLLRDEVKDILQYYGSRGKKKRELKDLQEERKKWILTPNGYYVDTEGKHRCPQCGSEIIHHNGCIKCPQCSWSQCTDN